MATKTSKPRPRTGEPRATRQPLRIDLLPPAVHEAIKRLKNYHGLTWAEIEELSALPYSKDWDAALGKHGFIDWDAVSARVLAKFPERRLPNTSLQRWYDLRVSQVIKEVLERSAIARDIGSSIAAHGIPDLDEAAINALGDLAFTMLQAQTDEGRAIAAKHMLRLTLAALDKRKTVVRERLASTEEKRTDEMEKKSERERARFEQETARASKKLSKGGVVTVDDINRLRERTFGLPPVSHA
jgi:hypothetical protein